MYSLFKMKSPVVFNYPECCSSKMCSLLDIQAEKNGCRQGAAKRKLFALLELADFSHT